MIRKLGFLVAIMSLALPAWSEQDAGTISGYVRDARGVPQMGAAVEILGSAVLSSRVFTNDRGFYSIQGLMPGSYSIRVSAPSFLPSLREKIGLKPGTKLMVNVTLTTLFDAIQLGPLRGPGDDDDWKWTLRSVANRPVLRVLPDGTTAVVQNGDTSDRELKGTLVFMAGSASQGFGSASDVSTGFSVEHSIMSSGTLSLNGNVAYGTGLPEAVIRTSYTNRLNNGFEPTVAFTVRRLNSPDVNSLHGASLQALSLMTSDRMTLGQVLELKFGSELQTIQFMGRVNAFRPFGTVDLHLSPHTVVEYQYASSIPNTRMEKGFDSAPMDLSETGPRMSITNFAPAVERAHHQEVSVSQRVGKTNMQVAFYSDRVVDPALTGVGDLNAETGEVLPDVYSGTFSYQGSDLETNGLRLVLQRKLLSDLTATLDYAYGGALDLTRPDVELQDAREWIRAERRHAVAAKFSGTVPRAKTHWIASYRWTNGSTLTPVDWFNTSAGQSDPYLNLFVRQPIPTSFLSGHVEVLVDLRNLLAQGYVPVLGKDGHTVYLVQSARSVRGGVAFNF
ncbi:MAG TPA: carboxypeptidase-like regulatory domain-containing protein [Terriglobales bacterium]|nr:carboxypeptidase-like regulatory domain-containing protein [Terriglobales bacterium]